MAIHSGGCSCWGAQLLHGKPVQSNTSTSLPSYGLPFRPISNHSTHASRLQLKAAHSTMRQSVSVLVGDERARTAEISKAARRDKKRSNLKTSCNCQSGRRHEVVSKRALPVAVEAVASPGSSPPSYPPSFYDVQGRLMLKNLSLQQLEDWCTAIGEDRRRGLHIWRWLYYDSCWIDEWDDTEGKQNGFSTAFRAKVSGIASVGGGLELTEVKTAADGTKKLVFMSTEGESVGGLVETVIIPIFRQQGRKPRVTVCVSSQVGCAMNCQFCYTGKMGLMANLTTAQIVQQVVVARRMVVADLTAEGLRLAAAPVTNIVFMGMGEPLHNLLPVMTAVDTLCHPLGLHFSYNKVTVSTVGLLPETRVFCSGSKAQLAVSLHAPNDEVRDWIVPVNRRWPVSQLIQLLEELFPRCTVGRHGRHVLLEYVMLKGVNDRLEHAQQLLSITQAVECKFNLIVFNPHEGTKFEASDPDQVAAFREVLIAGERVCTIRDSRGDDTMAACGQLGDPSKSNKPRPPVLQQRT